MLEEVSELLQPCDRFGAEPSDGSSCVRCRYHPRRVARRGRRNITMVLVRCHALSSREPSHYRRTSPGTSWPRLPLRRTEAPSRGYEPSVRDTGQAAPCRQDREREVAIRWRGRRWPSGRWWWPSPGSPSTSCSRPSPKYSRPGRVCRPWTPGGSPWPSGPKSPISSVRSRYSGWRCGPGHGSRSITSQLAGNAVTLIMPGGAAVGAALQFRMLAKSGSETGLDRRRAGGVLPPRRGGPAGPAGLRSAPSSCWARPPTGAWSTRPSSGRWGSWSSPHSGRSSWPMTRRCAGLAGRRSGSGTGSCGNGPSLEGLDETLLAQRNEIRTVLGQQWWQALLLSAGRLAFDYLCLLAALRATGSHPRPSLILVAYAVAGVVGMIPATPGGLGAGGGEPDRAPGAGRGQLQPGRPGHAHLPARLILGPAAAPGRWAYGLSGSGTEAADPERGEATAPA